MQVVFGCLCQYILMPLSGLFVARLFGLPPDLAAGLVLLSCCPGGTASNVVRTQGPTKACTPWVLVA